ncbi:adenylyltransferase/cytidyltransferase family protein [Pseudomonas sp. 21LCFQ02]|uniref:adenylyltransferase/cytidyltransferase family protein n=1 Tax=Pseudomonas sp. 21LCFQ02 TaxID=2957505 RepID=UPI00209B967C|nr:adenylyltransferase/cytidyltransferase family protein [Pseudomonas sp. 21LCFQ02]MCO8169395.1 adenylyltransferase/cytidyltransferase family protein [Pseudomonas sp. 21LCFQ02]
MYEIAVYGGAFNPPHIGHVNVMLEAARLARRVLVVPSFRHPDGKQMADHALRVDWLQRIVTHLQAAAISVSDVEQQLAADQPGLVYSYALLDHLAASLGVADRQLALVVGPDVLQQLPRFYQGEALLRRFAVISIAEQAPVRSSLLRERLLQGEALPEHWLAPGLNPLNYRHYAVAGH